MLHAWGAGFLAWVLPGGTALLLGGVLAAQGNISVVLLVALAIVAAIAGDSVGYEVGRAFGPSMKNNRYAFREHSKRHRNGDSGGV